MQTKDHLSLAKYIIRTANTRHHPIRLAYRTAFIFGCIEPDINMFSYIRGSLTNRPLSGHNYECSRDYMEKILLTLSSKSNWTISDYFIFGRFTHYATDSFTYPHNNIFPGNIRDHSEFEEKLHQKIIKYTDPVKKYHHIPLNRLFNYIEMNHIEYIRNCGSISYDCKYITALTNTIAYSIPYEDLILARMARQPEN